MGCAVQDSALWIVLQQDSAVEGGEKDSALEDTVRIMRGG